MSGLAALLVRDRPRAEAATVLAMLDAIPYRGPDGSFARCFGPAVLGHARMVVSAAERGEGQPLLSRRTGCAIVADARLDNGDELLSHLLPGSAAKDVSDAALLLRAYEQWGLDAPRHLLGDFAFIVWDPRSRRLMCARDGAGQRTLFYRADHREFAAASEIHQLLQDPRIPVEPNDERIRSALVPLHLNQNEVEQPPTYYTGVYALEPGRVLVVDADSLHIQRFWQLEAPAPLRYRRAEEYVEQFRELFLRAVATRLRTDGPLGALLSGGLDSSSIVCATQELFRSGAAVDPGFATFSAVFDGEDYDERALIESVHARWNFAFRAHYLTPKDEREWRPLRPGGFRQRPELPTTGMATLFDAAHASGTRVLLTGEVADSYLRGSPYVIDSLVRQAKFGQVLPYLAAMRRWSPDSLAKMLALYVVGPLLPPTLHSRLMLAAISRKLRLDAWWLVPSWIPNPLRALLLVRNQELALAREASRVRANETQHRQLVALEPPETPTIASGWPIEIWRPFADRRLVEFVLAVPPEHLFEPRVDDPSAYGSSKQLLRRGLRGLLPEAVRTKRAPTTFGGAALNALERDWPLIEAAFGPGGRPEVGRRGYVDQALFWERLQAVRTGRFGRDFHYVHYIIGLETWLRGLAAPRPQATTVSTRVRTAPSVLVNEDESTSASAASTFIGSAAPDQRTTLVLERR